MELDTQIDTQPETKTETPSETMRCQRCRKTFAIERFIDSDKNPDKVYAKCNECRLKLVNRKNYCSVCGIRACFNFPEESFGIRCKKHSDIGMIDIKHPKCFCGKARPIFNFENETRPTHCGDCKQVGMIDIVNPKCVICKGKQPHFNFENETRATHCGDCKLPEMINIVTPKCIVCKGKLPNFNFENETRATHCGDCKLPEMIDIKHPKCVVCKGTRHTFNFENETRATHCGDCKQVGMIDILHRKCVVCKDKIPVFNFEHETKPTHCGDCKQVGMIDIISYKCVVCKSKYPVFNFENETKPSHCGDCKSPEMIDIKSRKCSCGARANYALPGMYPEKCAKHKSSGMINSPRKQCEIAECKEFATHGLKGPVHCENHAQTDEYLLTERNCLKCNRLDILNAQGLCVNFCSLEERDRLMKKQVKKKEEFVRKLLTSEIDLQEYVIQEWQDSIIDPTCTKRRPDFVYHCGNHIVIVEVDEDQHRSYSNCGSTREEKLAGENRRMFEIFQIFQGLPVVFIRYNPDGFRVNQKTMKVSDRIRHQTLVQWVKKCLREFQPGLWVKYLYYDDFNETDIGLTQIQEKDVLV